MDEFVKLQAIDGSIFFASKYLHAESVFYWDQTQKYKYRALVRSVNKTVTFF